MLKNLLPGLLVLLLVTSAVAGTAVLRDEIRRLEAERQALLGRYTERHPEVRILSRQIDDLRQQLQTESASTSGNAQVGSLAASGEEALDAYGSVIPVKLSDKQCSSDKTMPDGSSILDNGKLKLVLGQRSGGFIDAAYLDKNENGRYESEERISLRPEGRAAIAVSYTASASGFHEGVIAGESVEAGVKVERVLLEGCDAEISGSLDYGSWGKSAFRVSLRTRYGSPVVSADFEFEPLDQSAQLVLKDASLRVFGDFDKRDPSWRRQSSSQGIFGTKPRPEGSYQFLTWQHGGHLVESPWYWREWSAWSMATGPVTTREGHVPAERLEYFMQDNTHGIRAALLEPAAIAPVEITGNGSPSYLAIHAWSPRVRARPLQGLSKRLYIKNIGIVFYETGLESLVKDGGKYFPAYNAAIKRSAAVLEASLLPALSNIPDSRLPEDLLGSRLGSLARTQQRGWDAEVERVSSIPRARKVLTAPNSGAGWIDVEMAAAASGNTGGYQVPARGGIPFPRGALHSPEQVRLTDLAGAEVPVQVDRLAVWPDGSVKWLLLTTLIDAGGTTTPKYRVEYGKGVSRAARFHSEPAVEALSGGGVTVDSGVLKFTLSKSGSGFIDTLWFDRNANGLYEPDEQLVKAEQGDRRNHLDLAALSEPADYPGLSFHSKKLDVEASSAVVDSIEVERRGPASIHLLVKGHYAYQELGRGREKAYQNSGSAFRLRYTVYAGQPYLEVKHWFVFEGNPDREMVHDLALAFTPVLGDGRSFTTRGDEQRFDARIEGTNSVGIYQDNPHSFEIWRSKGPADLPAIEAVGRAAAGWATVSDGKQAITFGLRNMRQSYAKELAIRDGRVEINLWPRRARLLDTRRYSRQYVDGESTSYGQGAAQGVARSHDLFLVFHAANNTAAAQAVAVGLQDSVFIEAHPQWYTKTRAAGYFGLPDADNFPRWEAVMADGLDYMLMHRDLWAWYGFYDYGDLQQRPGKGGSWGKRDGRWGWANNEALLDMWIYEQFLRTGVRDYLDAALAMTRHVMNVDLINAVPYKGNNSVLMQGHRHNVNHWGDGYVGIRVAAPQGFRLGYYLTGDLEIHEQLERILQNHRASMHSYDRSADTGLGILLFFWESTGDERYLKALNAYLDFQVAHGKKFGNMANPVWNFTRESWSAELTESQGNAPTTFFFQNFGSAYTLMELADLTGRQDVIDMLVEFARQTIEKRSSSWEAAYCHYRLMAFAYRHTGDSEFLDYAMKNAARVNIPQNRSRWPTSTALASFDNKLSMLAWTSQGLPYLIEAIKQAGERPEARGTSAPARMPANKWIAQQPEIAGGTISHLTYLPSPGGMLSWGFPAPGSTRYDMEVFDLKRRVWIEQIPNGAQAKLPPSPHQPRGSVVTRFQGEGPFARPGLPTPNRPYWVAGQVCYVPTLGKVLYFAGGATFLYDPAERAWEDLAIPLEDSPPDVMLGSMAWDPVRARVILFGGGYISAYKKSHDTPWNAGTWDDAAKRSTWAFDPQTNTWERLDTGSARLRELFERMGALSARLESALGAVRSHALDTIAVSGVPDKRQLGAGIRELGKDLATIRRVLLSAGQLTDRYEVERAGAAAALLQRIQTALVRAADIMLQDNWQTFHLLESIRWIMQDAVEELAPSPLPRYYGRMVTDTRNNVIVLFGGHGGNRVFADTWIFEPLKNQWRKSQSPTHPPLTPMPAMAFDETRGVVFVVGTGMSWIYDVSKDSWLTLPTEVPGKFFSNWKSVAYAPGEDVFVAVSTGHNLFNPSPRRTAVLRPDLSLAKEPDPGRFGGPTWSWLNPKYEKSIASLPRDDADYRARVRKQAAFFENLPGNEWKRVEDPGYVAQDRSYGSFTYDWDREQIVLWGGGHSAYMGNEVSQYDLKSNTWLESWPPDMPPWPFGSPDGSGWNPPLYHRVGSGHGYHHYTYNADSKMVAFFRGSLFYDPDLMRWSTVSLQPIGQGSRGLMVEMSGSPGLITASAKYYRGGPFGVWLGALAAGTLTRLAGSDTPIRSNDRAKPVYDSNRKRILWFGVSSGDNKKNNELWAFDIKDKVWRNLDPKIEQTASPLPENRQWGNAFAPKHDVMLMLPGNQGTWVYNASANSVRRIGPHPNNSRWSTKGVIYDEHRDVFVALTEGAYGTGPVSLWVLRHMAKKPE